MEIFDLAWVRTFRLRDLDVFNGSMAKLLATEFYRSYKDYKRSQLGRWFDVFDGGDSSRRRLKRAGERFQAASAALEYYRVTCMIVRGEVFDTFDRSEQEFVACVERAFNRV